MKVLKAALPALTLLLPLILLPARANASTLPADSGNFTSTVEITSVRHADGNTIIAGVETQTLTGLFTGTRVASGLEIVHADGTFEAHDSGTFTGTVDGRPGTVVISGSSTGSAIPAAANWWPDRATAPWRDYMRRALSSRPLPAPPRPKAPTRSNSTSTHSTGV